MKRSILMLTTASVLILGACTAKEKTAAPVDIETRASAILANMTLEEKIGQVIQADISAVTPEEVAQYNLGSVLNGGNSAPGGGKVAPPEDWIALADAFWDASTNKDDGGVGVPILWGTDAVHGHNNLQSATMFPHNSALGATHNADLMKQIGDVTAKEIRATGLDWTFAPTIAVARDDRWGRAYESYSENPALVAKYSAAIVEGLQGKPGDPDFLIGDNVMATAKHFIADGGTQLGIDKGDTLGDVDEIIRIHGAGYPPAIDAKVQSVMSSFSSINGEKMHGSKTMLTDVLRGKLGFEGFVVGDWNGHAEVPGCTATDCPQALHAGIDMYMAPDSWRGLYDSLLTHAQEGRLDLDRLDEAVTRILVAKIRSGLLEAGRPSSRSTSNPAVLGNPEHRKVARQAVQESLVLLKNENILPLNASQTILVTGSGANSMQQQTGGWTLNWQGTGNANDEFHTGETILSGIQAGVEAGGGTVIHSEDGSFETRPDVAVIVFGEQPYAEYRGDRSDVVFEFAGGEYDRLIESYKAQDIPVVTVFLTGRPMWVNPLLNASDAFVVAWLPGTEGGGVGDVLVGDNDGNPRLDFKGKLSFSWPSNGTGEPINLETDPGILFPYGYGLTYSDAATFEPLSEDPEIADISTNFDGLIFSRGDAAGAFGLYLGDSSNANTPSMALVSASLGGGIRSQGIDYKAQEDSRQFTWSGSSAAHMSVKSLRPIDLTVFGDTADTSLALTWRVDAAPAGPVNVSMGCGDGCGGVLNVSNLTSSLMDQGWTTTEIPLSCFVDSGLDPKKVNTALKIASPGQNAITLHAARLVQSSDAQMSCPN